MEVPNGVGEMPQAEMQAILDRQKAAFLQGDGASIKQRLDRLERTIALLQSNEQQFTRALSEDFGHRSAHETLVADMAVAISPLRHAQKHLARWQRRRRKPVTPGLLALFGARAWVEYQPLGVVGVISPWNFPIFLSFAPLAGIFSAGNRCMIKPSEYTPATSEAIGEAVRQAFDPDELAVVTGGPATGAHFSGLAFDHLLFTGATSVGKHVMRAAADNLVPVTLELGGKSPVIIGRSADLDGAADAVMAGKMVNAGQVCLAPDYVFVPEEKLKTFVQSSQRAIGKMFPSLLNNPDYSSVINERHFDRLTGYVDEARAAGAEVVEINPQNEDFRQQPHRKMPPTLIINPPEETAVMQEEIFGPLMVIKGYRETEETIDYVNDHDRPLGLYYFGHDRAEQERVLRRTTSGGVTLNDVVMHITQDNLPFGGVGPSGMGHYHGEDGFRTFSHAKAVYRQAGFNILERIGMRPPYGKKLEKLVRGQMK